MKYFQLFSDCRYSKTSKGVCRRTDYFEWTKEMSTYLVCVVIGEFEYLETKAAGRTTVRVYTPWGQREQGRFALEVHTENLIMIGRTVLYPTVMVSGQS